MAFSGIVSPLCSVDITQLDVDELAWPQVALRIGKICFELNRAGTGIGLVVHHDEAADVELRFVVLAEGDGLHRSLRHGVLNLRYAYRRKGENHADWLELGDDDQGVRSGSSRLRCRRGRRRGRRRCRRSHHIADIEQADSRDAVERGDESGISELSLGVFDRRLVIRDLRIEFIDGGLLVVTRLDRDGILLDQLVVALEVDLSIFKMDLVVSQRRLRLIELRLKGARIDLAEQVAFLDELALLEVHADQQSRDLALNRRGIEGCDRAKPGQHDWHVALLDGRCDDRNGLRRCGRRRRLLAIPPQIEDRSPGQKRYGGGGQHEFRPTATHHSAPCAELGA